ncbi:biotin synthase BioB [Parahalioglobus pacificus]|uniref:Biotin synthase n=1 Tax=Parahalioglobus pacificus TaxID=930806 RepID=A0A918XJP2_9GAMM|nr:biotin synthase BioB [Halioglobus pacificus]GHD33866.1 biotin synthase [Halioglobus pacificus]
MTHSDRTPAPANTSSNPGIRSDWTPGEVAELFELPFNDLLFRAQAVHRQYFDPNAVQISTLLSIKTGACPEDCAYCPQSTRFDTGLSVEELMDVQAVVDQAQQARQAGATRFCMGAAWRSPKDRDMPAVLAMVRGVSALGMETCMTLGMLSDSQAEALAEAGLDYYNHNLDTSPEYYREIISTRTYDDRLQTLERVRSAGMKVCCGGILGMGEQRMDRVGLLWQLATLPTHPESVPINQLVRVPGTPLADEADMDALEFVRTIAVARILMPASHVRLSAGREEMSEEMHALAFMAGANSIFYGDKLLTTANPEENRDLQLLAKLGISPEPLTLHSAPLDPDPRFYDASSPHAA